MDHLIGLASIVITGTWTPKDANGVLGDRVTFETYFDADIEVEMELVPVLTVAQGVASRDLTILLQPDRWFLHTDGTVWNLKDLEGQYGSVVEQTRQSEAPDRVPRRGRPGVSLAGTGFER